MTTFEAPGIRIVNGDCMVAMAGMKDKQYELAIVDPPYGIGICNSKEIGYKGFNKFTPKSWDNATPPPEYFTELFRVSVNQIIFGGNYFSLPPTRCYLVWDKGEGFKNRTYAEAELAWTSFDANTRIYKRDPLAKGDYHGKIHHAQKPVRLYQWLLKNYANPGDKILDTHGGSMSSVIAANIMGYEITCFEIDEEYFNAGVERVKRHLSQTVLDLG